MPRHNGIFHFYLLVYNADIVVSCLKDGLRLAFVFEVLVIDVFWLLILLMARYCL